MERVRAPMKRGDGGRTKRRKEEDPRASGLWSMFGLCVQAKRDAGGWSVGGLPVMSSDEDFGMAPPRDGMTVWWEV